jgi:hypothetical protein
MILDDAGVSPNPARDKHVRLPREEPEEINPPTAAHLESVYRLLPPRHRLAFLFLDWSGARVSAIDLTLVSDYDEPRRRVRLRCGDDEDEESPLDRPAPDARGRPRTGAGPARGSRPRRPSLRGVG